MSPTMVTGKHDAPTFSLVVIRVADIDRSVEFYSALGLTFVLEQHGRGPNHFSTQVGDTVFEIYPASDDFPVSTVRLGFTVTSIQAVFDRWQQCGYNLFPNPKESPWGLRTVVTDPDGHRIELTEKTFRVATGID